jgi:hypothetical protein
LSVVTLNKHDCTRTYSQNLRSTVFRDAITVGTEQEKKGVRRKVLIVTTIGQSGCVRGQKPTMDFGFVGQNWREGAAGARHGQS